MICTLRMPQVCQAMYTPLNPAQAADAQALAAVRVGSVLPHYAVFVHCTAARCFPHAVPCQQQRTSEPQSMYGMKHVKPKSYAVVVLGPPCKQCTSPWTFQALTHQPHTTQLLFHLPNR